MECKDIRDKLALYLDGELSELEHMAVERHIASCPDCAQELNALSSINAIGKIPAFPAPEEAYWQQLRHDIMRQIAIQSPRSSTTASVLDQVKNFIWPQKISYRLVGLAAAAIIVFCIVRLTFDNEKHSPAIVPTGIADSMEIKDYMTENDSANIKISQPPAAAFKRIIQGPMAKLDQKIANKERLIYPQAALPEHDDHSLFNELQFKKQLLDSANEDRLAMAETIASRCLSEEKIRIIEVVPIKIKKLSSIEHSELQHSHAHLPINSLDQKFDHKGYAEIYQSIEKAIELQKEIRFWVRYLNAQAASDSAAKAYIALGKLYYDLVCIQPSIENLQQALRFYQQASQFLLFSPDSLLYRKQLDSLRAMERTIK